MSSIIFCVGLLGALACVSGAAWPEGDADKPAKSVKNWLFTIGGGILLIYSYLGYLYTDVPFFFIILQAFAVISASLGLAKIGDRIGSIVTITIGAGFVVWSLLLFEDFGTIVFILGLTGIALGYVLKPGTVRRNLSLTIGGAMLTLFSLLVASWIYVGLNAFYSLFSAYHTWRAARERA